MPVDINPKGKNGEFNTRVAVEFSDRTEVLVNFTGFVAVSNPTMVRFGAIKRGTPSVQIFQLRSADAKELRILRSTPSVPWLDVVWVNDEFDRNAVNVKVSVRDDVPYGDISAKLAIETNSSEMRKCEIQIVGYVLKPIEVSQDTISLGYLSEHSVGTAVVVFRSPYAKPIEFVGLRGSDKLTALPIAGGKPDVLSVSFRLTDRPVERGPFKLSCFALCRVAEKVVDAKLEFFGYSLSGKPMPISSLTKLSSQNPHP